MWSTGQQRMLRAMGLQPLARNTAVAAPAVAPAVDTLPHGERSAQAASIAVDRLLVSILRAASWPDVDAGRHPDIERALQLSPQRLAELRGSAAARRALWPALRGWRRQLRRNGPP